MNGTRFAIAANAVDEIKNLDGLSPFKAPPGRFSQVKHTLLREKKDRGILYFVVDASAHFHIAPRKPGRLLILRDTKVAVLVDSIDRMAQIGPVSPLPLAFSGEERNWYRGLAVIENSVVPVLYPECFLSKGEVAVLYAGCAQTLAKGAATA
jgi:hypothetical protein